MIQARIAGLVLLIAAIAWGGWLARGWFEDSRDLAERDAVQKTLNAAMQRESRVATLVEKKLASLQGNERIIDRGVIREIQKPVYQRVCVEPELVRLLNAAADGDQASLSAKPADALPDDVAASD